MDLKIGQEVDGYRILEVIGRGGMGVVYRALDIGLNIDVALKVISPAMAKDEYLIKRFQTEAQTLARVNSRNIVSVKRFTSTEHGRFIVMEFVEGGDLSETVSKGPLPLPDALDIVKQLLAAFQDAHSVGIVHRDIKPANIMITSSGTVKVTDFGLAKIKSSDATRTMSQGVVGSLYYMSPEQLQDADVDQRSDLWSLGVLFYEILVGRRPFDAAYEASVMYAIMNEPVSFPEPQASSIPIDIQDIIRCLLEKNAEKRFQDATAVMIEIDAFQKGLDETLTRPLGGARGTRVSAPTAPARPEAKSRSWARISIIGLGILLLAVAGIYATRFIGATDDNGEPVPIDPPAADSTIVTLLSTTPAGARVYINGVEAGISPVRDHVLEGKHGSVEVRLTHAGYLSVDTTLNPALSHAIALTQERVPPAMSTITVLPGSSGTIIVDGSTTLRSGRNVVPAGMRRVACRHNGSETVESVQLARDQNLPIICYTLAKVNVVALDRNQELIPATVVLNGTDFGPTERWFDLEPGDWTISVRRGLLGARLLEGPGERFTIRPTFSRTDTLRFRFELTETRNLP